VPEINKTNQAFAFNFNFKTKRPTLPLQHFESAVQGSLWPTLGDVVLVLKMLTGQKNLNILFI